MSTDELKSYKETCFSVGCVAYVFPADFGFIFSLSETLPFD